MSKVVGLAFVKPTALSVLVRTTLDARIYAPKDTEYRSWKKKKGKLPKAVIVEDKRYYTSAVKGNTEHIIVCTSDFDWIEKRGITCLDAERDGDNIKIKNMCRIFYIQYFGNHPKR